VVNKNFFRKKGENNMYQATTVLLGGKKVPVVKNKKWYIKPNGKRQQSPVGATYDSIEDAQTVAKELNAHN